ncbi:MAG: hypothetical protein VXY86_11310, partial [Pseudomonadota bacterium]|jgi:hypothetical protein|nr:hypothetical protein [Pseudomonadota bacterium]MEC8517116.1 hypothetical protein [Pseudomonadota bacterium]
VDIAMTPAIDAMPTPTDRIFLVLSIVSSQKFASDRFFMCLAGLNRVRLLGHRGDRHKADLAGNPFRSAFLRLFQIRYTKKIGITMSKVSYIQPAIVSYREDRTRAFARPGGRCLIKA